MNGQVLEKNMKKLRYTVNQLEVQLRVAGVFDFGEVEFAILKPFGQLSVLNIAGFGSDHKIQRVVGGRDCVK